ncbi:MAG: acetyl-CoA carboxylase, biotin carboxyl carrier protein [Planctomycetaceae bacterium]|nr:MAG: acetyl-CoA carboxylase, biotin carboxyl carrier protein [Planctomycetaceae bacterium]
MARNSGSSASSASREPTKGGTSGAPFDLEQVQRLMELMEQHGVTELSLKRGDQSWRLRRDPPGGTTVVTPMYATAPGPASPTPPPQAAVTAAPTAPPTTPAADDGLLTIKAPTVGTFYAAQSPDDPPFVSIGSKVSPQTTVCLIEAMKVFNPITADVSGTIEAILVKNGDAVEYGQPLFKVRPA